MAQRISRAKATIADAGAPLRAAARGGARRAPWRRAARALPDVQRGLHRDVRRTTCSAVSSPREAIRLTRMTHALLPEDGEVAGLLALMLLTAGAQQRTRTPRRHAHPAGRAGPPQLGRRPAGGRNPVDPAHAVTRAARPVPAAGGDRRRTRRGSDRDRYRLAAGAEALRPLARARAEPGGHAQPGRRGRDGRWPARRAVRPRRAGRRPPRRFAPSARVRPRPSPRDGRRHAGRAGWLRGCRPPRRRASPSSATCRARPNGCGAMSRTRRRLRP